MSEIHSDLFLVAGEPMEKTADSETRVYRAEGGELMMRLPGNPEAIPYDGRFGPISDSVSEVVFPEGE